MIRNSVKNIDKNGIKHIETEDQYYSNYLLCLIIEFKFFENYFIYDIINLTKKEPYNKFHYGGKISFIQISLHTQKILKDCNLKWCSVQLSYAIGLIYSLAIYID